MNIPEEEVLIEEWLDTLAQKVLGEYGEEREYTCSGIVDNELFFLDRKRNFLIISGKKEQENHYVIALRELNREINGGFSAEVYSKNGGDGCRKLFSRTFNDPQYERARADAAKFARHLRDSEEILPELG